MGLILRVDVDKPYGRKTIVEKVKSKLRENYWFPMIGALGYLQPTLHFLEYLNKNDISGTFFHRNCTVPDEKVVKLLKEGNHAIGFHAENTKNLGTFQEELLQFRKNIFDLECNSFTKHGSGDIKLGKNHYAPYEPEKYRDWARQLQLNYNFGNGICVTAGDFEIEGDFYPSMFWIHRDYRNDKFNDLTMLVEAAKKTDIPVVIHPSNFTADLQVAGDFRRLVDLAGEHQVPWIKL